MEYARKKIGLPERVLSYLRLALKRTVYIDARTHIQWDGSVLKAEVGSLFKCLK